MRSGFMRMLQGLVVLGLLTFGPLAVAGKNPYFTSDAVTFALPDLEGRTVRSSDPEFRGKILLIDLWGTWCPPCTSEIPTLVDLQKRLGERGLVVIAIAFETEDEDEESRRARLRAFVEERGINYVVLDGQSPRDSDEALPGLKNMRGLPVEIVVGRDGRLVDVRNGYGYSKRWARRLERELVELLEVPPPGSPRGVQ